MDATKYLPIEISHIWGNNLKIDLIAEVDMIFIDTWHVYGQLKRELEKYSKVVKKYIIMHDTTVDAISGESIRCKWDIVKQSIDSGFPENEITCGLQRAIDEFLANNNHWKLHEKFTNNNGLTILKRL